MNRNNEIDCRPMCLSDNVVNWYGPYGIVSWFNGRLSPKGASGPSSCLGSIHR